MSADAPQTTTAEERAWYLKRLDIITSLGEFEMGIEVPEPTKAEVREYLEDYANESALLFERRLIAHVDALATQLQWYGVPEGWQSPEEPWCGHEEKCETLWQHTSKSRHVIQERCMKAEAQNRVLAEALVQEHDTAERFRGQVLGRAHDELSCPVCALLSGRLVATELERLRKDLAACCGDEDFRAVRNGWECDVCLGRIVELVNS